MVLSAHLSQLSSLALESPSATLSDLSALEIMYSIPSAMLNGESGSTSIPIPADISGIDVTFDVRTGVPRANDSRIGSPKPSYKEGYNNPAAPEYKHLSS